MKCAQLRIACVSHRHEHTRLKNLLHNTSITWEPEFFNSFFLVITTNGVSDAMCIFYKFVIYEVQILLCFVCKCEEAT